MATNVPPPPPPLPPPAGAPPAKKSNPLLWILLGCAGLILVIGIGAVVALSYGWHTFQRNPAAAMVRMAIAANPNAELVSIDESGGKVTIRDKRTGKTVTLNFEDAKRGRISFEGENGEKVTIDGQGESGTVKFQSAEGSGTIGAGTPITLPGWFPAYAGVTLHGTISAQDATSQEATFQFSTHDSTEQVLQFYAAGFEKAGLKATTLKQGEGGIVTAQDETEERTANVVVSVGGGSTQVTGSFKSKK